MNASVPTTRRTIHAIRPEEVAREAVGAPGLVLGGKYRLERRIATGGSASIWCATHVVLNRPVAVKFVDAPTRVMDHLVERFLREATVAASVRHKNVVDILDFGVDESSGSPEPYMIMELLEGEALDLMLRRGPLSTTDTVSVIWQVLSGLEAVHAAGIVHRDMKPGNVFITSDPDGLFARVIDFGISQSTDDTEDHTVVGTPEYMSPEQCFGETLDARTDLYSVGVMLYEMLAGFLPFDDTNAWRVLELVIAAEPPSLASARPDVPELCAVAMRAMAPQREDRWQSAHEMQQALGAALGMPEMTRHTLALHALRGSGEYTRSAATVDEPKAVEARSPSPVPPANLRPPPPIVHRRSTKFTRTGARRLALLCLALGLAMGIAMRWTDTSPSLSVPTEDVVSAPVLHDRAPAPTVVAVPPELADAPTRSPAGAMMSAGAASATDEALDAGAGIGAPDAGAAEGSEPGGLRRRPRALRIQHVLDF